MKKIKTSTVLISSFIITVATTVLDNAVYKENSVRYIGNNDIVAIHLSKATDFGFIVEKNLQSGEFKGIFSMNGEFDTSPTKVLENGKCIASDNKTVYFGATDGIYIYNLETNKTEKFGNLSVDVNDIQKHTTDDILYIISNNKLNKITEQGTRLELVKSVNDVQEIVLDSDNNIYLYENINTNGLNNYKAKVIVNDTVVDVKDLPKEFTQIKLTRSFAFADGALLILDNKIYRVFSNGTSVYTSYDFESAPTAYFLDFGIIQLLGHEKKLYLVNSLEMLLSGFKSFFNSISN